MSNETEIGGDLGVCPFCGGSLGYTLDAKGPNGLTHSMPMCRTFEREDPISFVAKANAELAKRAPS